MVKTIRLIAVVILAALSATIHRARAQAGFEDDRVVLQGFYWESYRHGHPEKFPTFGSKSWYRIVEEQAPAIQAGRFDLIWLPPPSFAGQYSAGYNPKEYFKLSNSYGDFAAHRAAVVALLGAGLEPIADIVINHRDSSACDRPQGCWANFKNPDWGTWAITRDDEAFTSPASEVFNTPLDKRGASEEQPIPYAQNRATTYQYGGFRDIDHTSERVRRDIIRYLLQLKGVGYRGWRYDMVHGYHARWIAVYNRATQPTFSVGEYDWDKQGEQRGWVWQTATTPNRLDTASSVFDFSTQFGLKDQIKASNYRALYAYGLGIGLVGDNTDGQPWKNRAVTFVENHDTGFRTNEDGTPEAGHCCDSLANGWQIEQSYAHILTHPGVPTVFWKHYFDWGDDLRDKIRALINARKVSGVHAGSTIYLQSNALAQGVYAARVVGRNGDLYIRIGGDDSNWQPSNSDYRDYREYAQGTGWKVWVGLPGNPAFREAPLRPALPVPTYQRPEDIDVPDSLLN